MLSDHLKLIWKKKKKKDRNKIFITFQPSAVCLSKPALKVCSMAININQENAVHNKIPNVAAHTEGNLTMTIVLVML